VNNAGYTDRSGLRHDLGSLKRMRSIVELDLLATINGCRLAGRQMLGQGTGGCIINVSSILGRVGSEFRAASYHAAKGGVDALTRVLALEYAREGIRVNAIAPSYFDGTELMDQVFEATPATRDHAMSRTPMGRLGQPEDLEGAIIYLASDAAKSSRATSCTWMAAGRPAAAITSSRRCGNRVPGTSCSSSANAATVSSRTPSPRCDSRGGLPRIPFRACMTSETVPAWPSSSPPVLLHTRRVCARISYEETEMLFVTIGMERASTTKARVARRAQWKYPAGVKVIGEYWLLRPDPVLVLISEADSPEPIMSALADWDDLMDLTVTPAMTAEQGLKAAAAILAASDWPQPRVMAAVSATQSLAAAPLMSAISSSASCWRVWTSMVVTPASSQAR